MPCSCAAGRTSRSAAGSFVSWRRLYAKASPAVIRSAASEYAESYGLRALARLAADTGTENGPVRRAPPSVADRRTIR